jgi:thiol-disulfide isomerase/thioredoxin
LEAALAPSPPRLRSIASIISSIFSSFFSIKAIDETNAGDAVSTADLIGQPLILNFWYSTCAPCKKELPDFATVHAELGDRIRFVGINPYDVPEVNESFARDRGIRYELLRDVADRFGSEVGIATAPFTLFVQADGTIQRQAGLLDETTLRQYAEELLG